MASRSRIQVEQFVLTAPNNSPYVGYDTRVLVNVQDNSATIVGDLSYTDLSALVKKANKIAKPTLTDAQRRERLAQACKKNY